MITPLLLCILFLLFGWQLKAAEHVWVKSQGFRAGIKLFFLFLNARQQYPVPLRKCYRLVTYFLNLECGTNVFEKGKCWQLSIFGILSYSTLYISNRVLFEFNMRVQTLHLSFIRRTDKKFCDKCFLTLI